MLDALDDAIDDFTDAVFVFVILAVALCVANLLHDNLFRSLRANTAKLERRKLFTDLAADFDFRIDFTRLFEGQLLDFVFQFFVGNNRLNTPEFLLTRFRVDLRTNVVLLTITRTGSFLDRLFHRLDDDHAVDIFLSCNCVSNLQDFKPVR